MVKNVSTIGTFFKNIGKGNELSERYSALNNIKNTKDRNVIQVLHKIIFDKTENYNFRLETIQIIGKIRSGNSILELFKLIKNENDWNIRLEAVKALGLIKKRHDIVIPFLEKLVNTEKDIYVRRWIPIILSEFGINAFYSLVNLTKSNDYIRKMAIYSLSKINDENNKIRDFLFSEMVKNENLDGKSIIALALYRIEGKGGKGEQILLEMVKNKELSQFEIDFFNYFRNEVTKKKSILDEIRLKDDQLKDTKSNELNVGMVINNIKDDINIRALESIRSIISLGIKENENQEDFGVDNFLDLVKYKEHEQLEFKPTFRGDLNNTQNRDFEFENLKTIVGFLNGIGGVLLIGVDDNGVIIGLDNDYKKLGQKPNSDGFQLMLNQKIKEKIGPKVMLFVKIYIEEINNKEFCIVTVQQSPYPIFFRKNINQKSEFFVRFGNSTEILDIEQYDEYRRTRWPKW